MSEQTAVKAPCRGIPFQIGEETIVPTYVHESEAPTAAGACVTADYTRPRSEFVPAGWYVEFHYVGQTESYRRFIPFDHAS